MKKLLFTVAIATIALVSCNKTDNQIAPESSQTGTEILINFDQLGGEFNTRSGEQPVTRAFYDNVAAAEPWEKKIYNATIFIFNSSNKLIMRKTFSATEITSMSAKVFLPVESAGVECTFYAVANCLITGTEASTTTNNIEYNWVRPSLYNFSSFDGTNSSSAMPTGIIMSDHEKVVIQPQGTPTNVSLLLRRPVAKLATKIFIDPLFSAKYGGGKVLVSSVKMMNSNSLVPIWSIGSKFYGSTRFEILQYSKQLSDGSFGNLFYVGESPAVTADDGVFLRIDAFFDQDGNITTTDDRIAAKWEIRLDGSGSGEIKRNAYYRVQATISGLNAIDDIRAVIVADEWETPSTQDVGSLNETNQK